ncbi:hypothetical protein [Streptomyces antimycoticus]|uniref:hypothetical protein n=1 Tax=Streptomyces antimycoticus TaxID=68175 RepID=UPI00386459A3|nr:hypothetical protein OG751_04110 [Streptomyces antimycoticus]
MAYERISKILETPDGAFVYAQANHATGEFRAVCSGCPDLQNKPRNSATGAMLAASYHAEHDPSEQHVPIRKK